MEKLIALLEKALVEARKPNATENDIAQSVKNGIEDVLNPHKALESELAELTARKTPPNGALYKLRADKSELAVAFFHGVYGRFYEAGVLYSHQLRALDLELYTRLANSKTLDKPMLRSKTEFNERMLKEYTSAPELLPRLTRAFYRGRKAV